ncbi:MAG: glycine cleavage system protein GcvH [Chlamydiota bacterium]
MYYTASHEWIQLKGQAGFVGITNYALKELGEIVYIQLPKVGQKFKMGEEICVLESTKAASDIYAPVSGKVIAVNEALLTSTSLINQAPETTGWLFQLEISHPKEIEHLLSKETYQLLIS